MKSTNFRFKLKEMPQFIEKELSKDELIAFFQILLGMLKKIVKLFDEEREINFNYFSFYPKKEKYKICGENKCNGQMSHILRYEPRIIFIGVILREILKLIKLFEKNREIEKIDEFSLKNLINWIGDKDIDKFHGDATWDVLKYLWKPCGLDCKFCLHKSDPPGYYTKSSIYLNISLNEIENRLHYFDSINKKGLFNLFEYGIYETISHPRFFYFLKKIRDKTSLWITLITNGNILTENIVQSLSHYMPLILIISLNSINLWTRKEILNDKSPEIAINSLPLLKKYKIPYIVSITHWYKSPLEEIEETIKYASENDCYCVRINLEAYSKYHPLDGVYDVKTHWNDIISFVKKIRTKYLIPIVFQPVLYEENLFEERKNAAIIRGVVKNSPAYEAGLLPGDEIKAIEGIKVRNRWLVKMLLKAFENRNFLNLTILRGDKILEIFLKRYRYNQYPWEPNIEAEIKYPWGIALVDCFSLLDFKKIKEIIKQYNSSKTLILTSPLVKPSLEELMILDKEIFEKINQEIFLKEVTNNYFLGGSIICGDLCVIEDYLESINLAIKENGNFDLIILPNSFLTKWGYDLKGIHIDFLKERVNSHVYLINNEILSPLG